MEFLALLCIEAHLMGHANENMLEQSVVDNRLYLTYSSLLEPDVLVCFWVFSLRKPITKPRAKAACIVDIEFL